MRHLLMLVSVGLLLSLPSATSLAGQSHVPSAAPSPKAACLLKMLDAEGFRLQLRDSTATEQRFLTRILIGVDSRRELPDPSNPRVQLLEVRIDGAAPGLELERAIVLRPQVGDQSAFAAESERLDREIRARLRDTEPRCPA